MFNWTSKFCSVYLLSTEKLFFSAETVLSRTSPIPWQRHTFFTKQLPMAAFVMLLLPCKFPHWKKNSKKIQKKLNRPVTKFYNSNDVNVIAAEIQLTKMRPTFLYRKYKFWKLNVRNRSISLDYCKLICGYRNGYSTECPNIPNKAMERITSQ